MICSMACRDSRYWRPNLESQAAVIEKVGGVGRLGTALFGNESWHPEGANGRCQRYLQTDGRAARVIDAMGRFVSAHSNELDAHSAHPEHDHCRNDPGDNRAADHEFGRRTP